MLSASLGAISPLRVGKVANVIEAALLAKGLGAADVFGQADQKGMVFVK